MVVVWVAAKEAAAREAAVAASALEVMVEEFAAFWLIAWRPTASDGCAASGADEQLSFVRQRPVRLGSWANLLREAVSRSLG